MRRRFKLNMLRDMMAEKKAVMVALTETHLNPDILDAEVHIEGYQLFRTDRGNRRLKGGVAIYLREHYAVGSKIVAGGSNGVVEYLLIHLEPLKTAIVNVYRPPTATAAEFIPIMTKIKEELLTLEDQATTIIVCGDFNFPRTSWREGSTEGGSSEERRQAEYMVDFQNEILLTQVIEKPTRGMNILDLVFTNNLDLVIDTEIQGTKMSDHNIVIIRTALGVEESQVAERDPSGFRALNFFHSEVKWKDIKREMESIDWISTLANKEIEDMHQTLEDQLLSICERHVPKKKKAKMHGLKIPRDRKILMRRRCKWNKKLSKLTHRNDIERLKYKLEEVEERIKESHMEELKREENKAIDAIKLNSKFFFKYADKKKTMRAGIGPLKKDGQLVSDPAEMSELLREHYETVFSAPLEEEIDDVGAGLSHVLDNITFTPGDFVRMAQTLRSNSSAGPDGIPALLLKNASEELAEPLWMMWKESLRAGLVPRSLKVGFITPIFKGGEKSGIGNYRPVSLTSHLIKLFEKVVVEKMTAYLIQNDLYNKGQHGFRAGRSCLSQLLSHHVNILNAMSQGMEVDVVYLDFAKAFDKVDHRVLLSKLRNIGICGPLLSWISNFLKDRMQHVSIEGYVSRGSKVISGVPQGSVLGPLLFVIHIADMSDTVVHSTVTSFADDTRVCKPVRSTEECQLLQDDLESIYEWARRNNMFFNGAKFELLRYKVRDTVPFTYRTADRLPIAEKESVTDLGVLMSNTASFKEQVSEVATRGRQRMGWICRVFATRDKLPMMTLYRALVLPILEYCCQLWHPVVLGDVRRIEAVQRTFTSRITGMNELSYWDRLRRLKLYSLERRRERYLMIYVWKIIQGLVPNFEGIGSITVQTDSERRGKMLEIPPMIRGSMKKITTLRENSLIVLGARLFNCLPRDAREWEGGLETFKEKVDRFLTTVPDKPALPHYHQSAASNSIIKQLEQMRAERGVPDLV